MKTKEDKKIEAEVRQAAYAKLTPAQKLAQFDATFGPGKGAAKERAKILKANPELAGGAKVAPESQQVPEAPKVAKNRRTKAA